MTRHRLRRERLVRPGRTAALTLLVVSGLGVVLAWPADSPETSVGQSFGAPGGATPSTTPNQSPTPSAAASTSPRPTPTAATTSPTPEPTLDERTRMEVEVTELTNAERVEAGCGPVRPDDRLRDAARRHSEDMAERRYFAHTSPDGETPWDRAAEAGYDTPSAENIAQGFRDAESVVEAWMNSPGHRANILNCDSRATGVGVELDGDGDGAPYWTQMFGYQ